MTAAVTRAIVEEAVETGFQALVVTVDAPRAGRRERDRYSGFALPADLGVPAIGERSMTVAELFDLIDRSLTWTDFAKLVSESPLPVLVKGIHTAEDALLAVEHGAAGVVVSNHGGRQLDGVPATIEMLPGHRRRAGRADHAAHGRGHPARDGRPEGRGPGSRRCDGRSCSALGPRLRWTGRRRDGATHSPRRDRTGNDTSWGDARLGSQPRVRLSATLKKATDAVANVCRARGS